MLFTVYVHPLRERAQRFVRLNREKHSTKNINYVERNNNSVLQRTRLQQILGQLLEKKIWQHIQDFSHNVFKIN